MIRRLNIFMACASMGFKNALADKILIVGAFLIYAIIMILYGGVIKMIPEADLVSLGLTYAQMVWYLGTTELILFTSAGWAYKEIQASYKTEEAHLGLLRPASYAFVRFSFWAGESCARMAFFLPLYFVFNWWLAGAFVMSWLQVLGMLLSMPLAAFILNCGAYMIGVTCLWFEQSDPAYWIWQKLIFLLGAMLWPILFYPVWLQKVSMALPFYGILAHGGNWTLDLSTKTYVLGFLNQIVWVVLFLWFLRICDRFVLRRIQKGEV